MELVNALIEATSERKLESKLKKYVKPQLLLIDELGYIPLDKAASELLFQVFARRYEEQYASTIITTNRAFKEWPITFANDAVLTSAVLDRILHRCEVVTVEGTSYRMRKAIVKGQ
jgi:DNA replication protein DnaC